VSLEEWPPTAPTELPVKGMQQLALSSGQPPPMQSSGEKRGRVAMEAKPTQAEK